MHLCVCVCVCCQVVKRTYDIVNVDRSTLGRLAGAIARQHGNLGFKGKIDLTFMGR